MTLAKKGWLIFVALNGQTQFQMLSEGGIFLSLHVHKKHIK